MTTHPHRILKSIGTFKPTAMVLALLATALPLFGETEVPIVVFFGDSLTAGFGVEPEQAYPSLIQTRITEAGLPHQVVNAGLSGETTAAGLRRVDWILRRPVAVFVLALGGNDGLRGIPTEETRRNLDGILRKVNQRNPDVRLILAGMEAPPNMGEVFTTSFREIFPPVAEQWEAILIPFLLEGVGGEPEFNLSDGIHPNPEGHQIIAELVWAFLEPVLSSEYSTGRPE